MHFESEMCVPCCASALSLSLNSFLEGYKLSRKKIYVEFTDTKSNPSLSSLPALIHVFLLHPSNVISGSRLYQSPKAINQFPTALDPCQTKT